MSTYIVKSVSESPAGYSVSVGILRDGTDARESVEFLITRELWLWGRLKAEDVLPEDEYFRMEHNATFSRALARMRGILSYSGQSRHSLISRLRHYGFDDEICEETADFAEEHGLVQETQQAEHAADIYIRRKYWGKKRIIAELSARGYAPEVIRETVDAIPESEFMRALCTLIQKKYGEVPRDGQERQKMVLSLLRLGYSGQEIKDAVALLEQIRDS